MARRNGVAMSVRGYVAPGRGKGGDNTIWTDMNLSEPKNEEYSCGRFKCYNGQ
jgi:hypothetical protein